MTAPKTIGFIGLGQMGEPMCAFICKGDTLVLCYDRAPGLAPAGARELGTLGEVVAGADTLFLSVPDGKIVTFVASEIDRLYAKKTMA